MAADAIKKSFSLTFAKDLADNFNNDADDQYFLLLGKIDQWQNSPYNVGSDVAAANVDTVEKSNYAWRDGIALKRISSRNIYHMIPRNNWTHGVVYDPWDHTIDIIGGSKTFFVYTASGNVYKCIDNNSSASSVYEPDHTTIPITEYNDGYKWKFMYHVAEDSRDFISTDYIPVDIAKDNSDTVLNQWNTQQNATVGSIELIKTTLPAGGFTAATWRRSEPNDSNESIGVGGSTYIGDKNIKLNLNSADTDDYYNGYAIYITSGPGVGIRRVITRYVQADKTVFFEDALTENIHPYNYGGGGEPGSLYRIVPNIIFDGDGISAEAYPLFVQGSAQIENIAMINSGKDYTIANVRAEPIAVSGGNIGEDGIIGPTFDVIIPPPGGHGSNVLNEFCAKKIMVRATVKGLDSAFPTPDGTQQFRQVSIVKNPLISGGTNDGKILGTEITRRKQLTVTKPWFGNGFNDNAFTVGNSIIGETTKATGKIEKWTTDANDNSVGTLELSNVQGTLDVDDPAAVATRIVFSSDASGGGNFTVGYTVKQTVGTLTAEGNVLSWDSTSRELIINVTSNTFVADQLVTEYDMAGTITGVSRNGSDVVERKMGELIKHYSSAQGADFAFINFPASGTEQNVARANKLTDVQDEELLENSYALTTKIVIVDSTNNLDSTTYTNDNIFAQVVESGGISGSFRTGKIAKWTVKDEVVGNTGELFLTDVRGSFATGGISGSADHEIDSVFSPGVQIGSGEVLYIQNIDPVTRTLEQDEEIKILIGF